MIAQIFTGTKNCCSACGGHALVPSLIVAERSGSKMLLYLAVLIHNILCDVLRQGPNWFVLKNDLCYLESEKRWRKTKMYQTIELLIDFLASLNDNKYFIMISQAANILLASRKLILRPSIHFAMKHSIQSFWKHLRDMHELKERQTMWKREAANNVARFADINIYLEQIKVIRCCIYIHIGRSNRSKFIM